MTKEMIKTIKKAIKELRKSTSYVQVPSIVSDAYHLVQKGNIIIFKDVKVTAMVNIALEKVGVTSSRYYVNERDGKIQEAINYLRGLLNAECKL